MENRTETDAGLVVSSRKRLKNRLAGMSLFWKACLLAAGLLMAVVILAEATLEPLGEALLEGISGGFRPWHEAVVWITVILLSSLACGYVLSAVLTRRLDKMVRASRALAGLGVMRTMAESTLGAGTKAVGGTMNSSSMSKRYCSITDRRP